MPRQTPENAYELSNAGLLAAIGGGSEFSVDALVVATAVRLGGGLVLTHEPADLRRLAAGHPNVAVAAI